MTLVYVNFSEVDIYMSELGCACCCDAIEVSYGINQVSDGNLLFNVTRMFLCILYVHLYHITWCFSTPSFDMEYLIIVKYVLLTCILHRILVLY
jgi:hypothetical protein